MKLAFAALAATLALASGASAMIGPYEYAVNDPANHASLFSMGEARTVTTEDRSSSPEGTFGNMHAVTVFVTHAVPQVGASAR